MLLHDLLDPHSVLERCRILLSLGHLLLELLPVEELGPGNPSLAEGAFLQLLAGPLLTLAGVPELDLGIGLGPPDVVHRRHQRLAAGLGGEVAA